MKPVQRLAREPCRECQRDGREFRGPENSLKSLFWSKNGQEVPLFPGLENIFLFLAARSKIKISCGRHVKTSCQLYR